MPTPTTPIVIRPNDRFVIAAGMPYDGTWQVEGEPGYWPASQTWAAFTITATLVSTTRDDNGLGDVTETETTTEIPGCLFAPRASSERVDPRSPAVISGASLYIPSAGIEVAIKRAS